MDTKSTATEFLCELAGGDPSAAQRLLPLVYADLRVLARRYLQRAGAGHTLQPTALVNEAFVRLIDQTRIEWRDRAHFFALCASAMRLVLADHARRRRAAKRGGRWQRVTLEALAAPAPDNSFDLLDLDEALAKLAQLDPRHSRMVELRFFAGLTVEEVAEVLNCSKSTVESDWRVVRAWLTRELGGKG